MKFGHAFCQLEPTDLGHDHVRDQNVDRAGMVLGEFQRFAPVLRLQYLVTLGFKQFAQHIPNGRLILGQEHRFASHSLPDSRPWGLFVG